MRLFLAVRPPEHVLDHLDLALAGARRGQAGPHSAVRWAARETWHVTTAFYGEVADGLVPDLVARLADLTGSTAPYDLELRGAGVFAHRTVWVGVGGEAARQRALATAAAAGAAELGITVDDRARQRAHLTVGRARVGGRPPGRRGTAPGGPRAEVREVAQIGGVDALVRALSVYDGPAWTVGEVTLERSEPGSGRGGGPRYTVLERLPLHR